MSNLKVPQLVVPFNPYHYDTITLIHTIDGLGCPWGIDVSDDGSHVIVTEYWSNCVTVLDREGKKVKSFGG